MYDIAVFTVYTLREGDHRITLQHAANIANVESYIRALTHLAPKQCENTIKERPPREDAVSFAIEDGRFFLAADDIAANIEPWNVLI